MPRSARASRDRAARARSSAETRSAWPSERCERRPAPRARGSSPAATPRRIRVGRAGHARRRRLRRRARRRWTRRLRARPGLASRVARSSSIPVGLAQVAAVAPAALELAGRVHARARSRSTASGIVSATNGGWRPSGVTQLAIAWCWGRCRRTSGRPRLDRRSRPGRTVSENSAIVRRTAPRASSRGGRGEVHAVGEQRVELVAHLALGPLRIGLPAGDRLEAGRALQRHRFREAAVDHQRRLVDLQRHRHPVLGRHEILLARERRVEHADEQLHQHGGVAGAHRAERALDDEHLAAGDHTVEVDASASR